jgi:glycosyltransferase involved in cell wall biosynthesis
MRYYKNTPLADKVYFVDRKKSQVDVANVMRQMDCALFPARAEGFNLELLEALSCGLHVITTDYSAHTEYCNKNNSLLVEVKEKESAYDGIWFKNQGNWGKLGEVEIDQIAEYMNIIHASKQNGNCMINTNGIETAKQFSWENTTQLVKEKVCSS